jgi:LEA14-like dessication related protein
MSALSRWLRSLSLALLLTALLHCARPVAPTLTPRVARVAAVSASGLDLEIEVQVDNPNAFDLHAQSVTGTVYVGSGRQRLAHGSSHPGQTIPARGSVVVPSRVHVAWTDATAIAPLLVQEKVPYILQGDVTLGSEDWNVTLPFSITGDLSRAQLLAAGWRGL